MHVVYLHSPLWLIMQQTTGHGQVTWIDERRSSCIQVLTGSRCTPNDGDEELSSNLGSSRFFSYGGIGAPRLKDSLGNEESN
jgi:hypothetical protein